MPIFNKLLSTTPDIRHMKQKGDLQGLIRSLEHKEAYIRWSAASALGELAENLESLPLRSRAVDGLSAIISEPGENNTARWNAIKALGQIGAHIEEPALLTRVVTPLNGALITGEGNLRLAAAEAIGIIGEQLKDPSLSNWVIAPLITALNDENTKVREFAIDILIEVGEAAEAPLINAMGSKNRKVREGAAEALRGIGWSPGKDASGTAYWIIKNQWDKCVEIGVEAVDPLVAALKFASPANRQRVSEALAKIGPPAVEALVKTLYDDEKDVRKAAAEALEAIVWEIPDRETEAYYWIAKQQWSRCMEIGRPALEPLMSFLKDKDAGIRRSVIWSLGRSGEHLNNKALLEPVIEPLITALKDNSKAVCRAAAESLGRAGAQINSGSLRALVQKSLTGALSNSNRAIRQTAAEALDQLGWKPERGESGARYWIAKCDWEQAVALGGRAVNPLIAILLDNEKEIRQSAAATLEQLQWQPDRRQNGAAYWIAKSEWERCAESGEAAVAALCTALRLDDIDRQAAAGTLGSLGAQIKKGKPRALAVKALCSTLDEDDARQAAARALGEIGDAAAIPSLIGILQEEEAYEAAGEALVRIGSPAIQPLIGALKDHDTADLVVDVLIRFGNDATRPLIQALYKERINQSAAEALDKLGWKPGADAVGAQYWIVKRDWDRCVQTGAPAYEPLLNAFNEGFESVRQAAAAALGDLGDGRAVQPLLTAFDDHSYAVRRRAAGALDRLGWKPGKDETGGAYWITKRQWDRVIELGSTAVETLIEALKDRDEQVRLEAAKALGKIGDGRAEKALAAALKDRHLREAAAQSLREIARKKT